MRIIAMMGPQGSGKGTQSDRLAPALKVPHVALGSLFRAEIAAGTDIGQEVASYINKGEIVPLGVANRVIADRLSKGDADAGVILDGYPRTMEQAQALDELLESLGRKLTDAVHLSITDEEAVRRLAGRRMCSNTQCERNYHVDLMPPRVPDVCDACGEPLVRRKDDVPDAIRRRLEIYHKETAPVVDHYRQRGLLREIDGARPIEEVQAEIKKAIGA